MNKSSTIILLVAALILSACVSNQDMLNKYQTEAIDAAEKRARFDMRCDALSSQVISAKIDDVPSRVWVQRMPIERQQYEIGLEGCGERKSYKVLCDGNRGCNVFD
ncbi:MAG: hypothetical protein ACR2QG_12530 [Gammaproteobacteria bacterium]